MVISYIFADGEESTEDKLVHCVSPIMDSAKVKPINHHFYDSGIISISSFVSAGAKSVKTGIEL